MKDLAKYTNQQLLAELICRNGIGPAADKSERVGHWDSILISITPDECAEIVLPRESTNALFGCDLGDDDYQHWIRFTGDSKCAN